MYYILGIVLTTYSKSLLPPIPEIFEVDHSFFYVITFNKSLLFAGKIIHPSESEYQIGFFPYRSSACNARGQPILWAIISIFLLINV